MTDPAPGANLVDVSPRHVDPFGLAVGPLAFGCWRFVHDDVRAATTVLEAALDATATDAMPTLVDTADVYGLDWGGAGFGEAEALLGRVLAGSPALRDRLVLATKGGIVPGVPYDSSARALRAACEASLRRLGVEQIDLYQVHRPDLFTHPVEVAETLVALVEEGKVGHTGISNHTLAQHDALAVHLHRSGGRIATAQPELSVAQLGPVRNGILDRCQRDDVLPLAWSPLAGGRVVTGEGLRPELVAALDRLARREGVDRGAIALAFVLAHPSRPVAIVGSQRPDRWPAVRAALGVHLDRTDCYALVEASEGVPLP